MKIIDAFRHGLSLVTKHQRIVAVIYLVNLCIGLVFAAPLFIFFHGKVGRLAIREELVAGFSYSWWSTFDFSAEGLEKTIRPALTGGFGPLFDNLELLLTGQFQTFGWFVFAIAVVYLFVAAFLNGGAIGLFADERKSFSTGRFFSNAGAFFHHMAALAATAILVFALLYKVINPLVFSLVDSIVGETTSQPLAWFVNLAGYLVILMLVFFLTLVLDYAKIIVINEKKESSWLCIWLSLKFMVRNFSRIVGLNLLLLLIALAVMVIGGALMSLVQPTQFFLLILAILIQQVYILAKIAVRLTFYAAESALYQQQTAAATVVKKRKR